MFENFKEHIKKDFFVLDKTPIIKIYVYIKQCFNGNHIYVFFFFLNISQKNIYRDLKIGKKKKKRIFAFVISTYS